MKLLNLWKWRSFKFRGYLREPSKYEELGIFADFRCYFLVCTGIIFQNHALEASLRFFISLAKFCFMCSGINLIFQNSISKLGYKFRAIYDAKYGHFKLKYLKCSARILIFCHKNIWIRSFKWGTIKLSMTIYSKVISCQSSQSKKYSRPFGFEATYLQVVY